jgi:hypothetical protein
LSAMIKEKRKAKEYSFDWSVCSRNWNKMLQNKFIINWLRIYLQAVASFVIRRRNIMQLKLTQSSKSGWMV